MKRGNVTALLLVASCIGSGDLLISSKSFSLLGLIIVEQAGLDIEPSYAWLVQQALLSQL